MTHWDGKPSLVCMIPLGSRYVQHESDSLERLGEMMKMRLLLVLSLILASCSAGKNDNKNAVSKKTDFCSALAENLSQKNFDLRECQKSVLVTECKDGSIKYSSLDQTCSQSEGYRTDLKFPDG